MCKQLEGRVYKVIHVADLAIASMVCVGGGGGGGQPLWGCF